MGTEALANAGRKSQDVRDLNLQLEDIRKSNTELRDSRLLMRRHHDEEIVRMEREHEEKILFLLGQLNKDTPVESNDVSLNKDITDVEQRLKFQAEELNKMSELHDKLMAKDEECATLKLKLQRRSGNLLPIIHQGSPASLKKKQNRRVTIKLESYSNADEYFEDQDDSITKKRTSKLQGCTCKKGCKTKACSCKKAGSWCVVICKCDRHACANREVPGTDVSSSVETDKENEDLDDTDQLLDSTYDVKKIPKLDARSPMKPIFNTPTTGRNSGADIFAADSDVDATPKSRPMMKTESIFSHPQID